MRASCRSHRQNARFIALLLSGRFNSTWYTHSLGLVTASVS